VDPPVARQLHTLREWALVTRHFLEARAEKLDFLAAEACTNTPYGHELTILVDTHNE
jgi:hypothetical protein